MIGEVRSKKRPLNSLLEAELDFESAAKPVPIITEETTDSLEDMIKQRIRDASFDDVIRKKIIQTNWKPRMELDHEKSKLSLAEIYEKEYETQVMGKKKEETPLDKIHKNIVDQFKRLCTNLDALSNFHFTPKEVQPDLVIKQRDIGSIMQEDITPMVHSKEMSLAPAEIYAPKEKSKLALLDAAKEHGEITQQERGKRRALIKEKHKANKEADAKKIKEKEVNYLVFQVKHFILTSFFEVGRSSVRSKEIGKQEGRRRSQKEDYRTQSKLTISIYDSSS